MSEFKYLVDLSEYEINGLSTWDEDIEIETVYQLKRIADALEWQKPFHFDGWRIVRSDVHRVSDVRDGNGIGMKGEWVFFVEVKGSDRFCFGGDTKEIAEATRKEFLELLEGES